jgi:hypothetical protein
MATSNQAVRHSAADSVTDGLGGDIAEFMRALKALVDPYRPEQHYMRGPGPKWHAKHDEADDGHPMPALVRVKA